MKESVHFPSTKEMVVLPPEFRLINSDEMELVKKMFDRGKLDDTMRVADIAQCRVGYVSDGKFTIAALIRRVSVGAGDYQAIYLGAAKRITYSTMRDAPDPEVGMTIAFCRAVSSAPIGLPALSEQYVATGGL
jgi:hypothetical protein